jgi:recombination protein RecA
MSDVAKIINKKFGKDVVLKGSDPRFQIKKIPTGVLSLDILTMGGFARGRWVDEHGDYSGLKTTVALKVMAQAQKMGYKVAYIDAERTMTTDFMEHHGVDISEDNLDMILVDNGEEAVDVLEVLLRQGQHAVVVVDSVAAMLPKRMSESSASSEHMGLEGKMTSAMTRKLTSLNKDTIIFLINQEREAIGRFFGGTPKTTPGGRAIGFYSSQTIQVRRGKIERKEIKVGGKSVKKAVGRIVYFTLTKDKTGAAEEESCELYYDLKTKDIDPYRDLVSNLLKFNLLKKQGSNYVLGKTKMYGLPRVLDTVSNPKVYRKLYQLVLDKAGVERQV